MICYQKWHERFQKVIWNMVFSLIGLLFSKKLWLIWGEPLNVSKGCAPRLPSQALGWTPYWLCLFDLVWEIAILPRIVKCGAKVAQQLFLNDSALSFVINPDFWHKKNATQQQNVMHKGVLIQSSKKFRDNLIHIMKIEVSFSHSALLFTLVFSYFLAFLYFSYREGN